MSMLRAAGSHTLTASGPLALRPRLSTGLPFLSHISIIPPSVFCQPEINLFCPVVDADVDACDLKLYYFFH